MRNDNVTHCVEQPILKGTFPPPVITWIFFEDRWVKKTAKKAARELVRGGDAISLRITFCALAEAWLIVPQLCPSCRRLGLQRRPDRKNLRQTTQISGAVPVHKSWFQIGAVVPGPSFVPTFEKRKPLTS